MFDKIFNAFPIFGGSLGGIIAAVPLFTWESVLWTIFCALVFGLIGGFAGWLGNKYIWNRKKK